MKTIPEMLADVEKLNKPQRGPVWVLCTVSAIAAVAIMAIMLAVSLAIIVSNVLEATHV